MADVVGGTIIWNLDADDKKLSAALDKARANSAKTAEQVDRNFSSLSKSITTSFHNAERGSQIFATGILGAATAVGGFLAVSLKGAGQMEMLRSSLDTLTGSADKGAQVFQDLNKFAASTPFETKDLAKATETMLSFGISSDKVMPNLQMLGDISLGNAEKLQGLSLAFSQVQSTGRLMGQDLLQMINQGFNPLTIISQKTGKSMAVLKEEMAAGKISFQQVEDAMKTATSEGGLFFKGMERGAKTLPGIWSTFMDQVGMTTRELVGLSDTGEIIEGGLVDKVKTAISGLTTFLAENQDGIISFFKTGIGWLVDNGPMIAGIIVGGITPAVVALGASFAAAMIPLLPFIAAGAALGLGIQFIVNQLGGWQAAQEKIGAALNVFAQAFNQHVLPAVQQLWSMISAELLPALSGLWTAISPVLMPVLKALAVILGGTVIVALRAVVEVLKFGVEWVTGLIKSFTDMVNFFRGLPNMVTNALSGLTKAITKPFDDAWNSVKATTDKIKGQLDKVNPFHRESPSLVDNVQAGVAEISSQYKSLRNISIPPVAHTLNFPTAPTFTPTLTQSDFESDSSSQKGSQYITFEEVNINDRGDIDSLVRELGFMANITPGVIA